MEKVEIIPASLKTASNILSSPAIDPVWPIIDLEAASEPPA